MNVPRDDIGNADASVWHVFANTINFSIVDVKQDDVSDIIVTGKEMG